MRHRNVGDYITAKQRLRQKLPVGEDVENVFGVDHDFCDSFCALDGEQLVILRCLKHVPEMRTRDGANERGLYERNATNHSGSHHADAHHTVWMQFHAARTSATSFVATQLSAPARPYRRQLWFLFLRG